MKLLQHVGLLAAATVSLGFAASANATPFTVTTSNQGGATFDASAGAPGLNAGITASFNYTGPLTFNDSAPENSSNTGDLNSNFFLAANMTGYSGSGTLGAPSNADFSTLASFLASSGSAAGYQYGSFYTIDLGILAAGTLLTITHDDGMSIYQGGVREGSTTSGPTSQVTESVTLTSTDDTILYYARENGTPSILELTETAPAGVPEPTSLALLGTGLLSFGWLKRRRRQT